MLVENLKKGILMSKRPKCSFCGEARLEYLWETENGLILCSHCLLKEKNEKYRKGRKKIASKREKDKRFCYLCGKDLKGSFVIRSFYPNWNKEDNPKGHNVKEKRFPICSDCNRGYVEVPPPKIWRWQRLSNDITRMLLDPDFMPRRYKNLDIAVILFYSWWDFNLNLTKQTQAFLDKLVFFHGPYFFQESLKYIDRKITSSSNVRKKKKSFFRRLSRSFVDKKLANPHKLNNFELKAIFEVQVWLAKTKTYLENKKLHSFFKKAFLCLPREILSSKQLRPIAIFFFEKNRLFFRKVWSKLPEDLQSHDFSSVILNEIAKQERGRQEIRKLEIEKMKRKRILQNSNVLIPVFVVLVCSHVPVARRYTVKNKNKRR